MFPWRPQFCLIQFLALLAFSFTSLHSCRVHSFQHNHGDTMDFTDEQTPLISSNRESTTDSRLGPGRRGFYSVEPNVANSRPRHDFLPRPQRQPPRLHQSLERASRHEQAHVITSRHWLVLTLACLLLLGNYYCYDVPGVCPVWLTAC